MIGDRLKKLRNKLKLTQKEIAKIFKMSRSTYAQYEVNRRKPDYDTVNLFADYFNVSPAWIIYGNKTPILNDPKYSDLGEITLEEEYARKGLTKEMQRHYLDAAALVVEEARKMHDKRVK